LNKWSTKWYFTRRTLLLLATRCCGTLSIGSRFVPISHYKELISHSTYRENKHLNIHDEILKYIIVFLIDIIRFLKKVMYRVIYLYRKFFFSHNLLIIFLYLRSSPNTPNIHGPLVKQTNYIHMITTVPIIVYCGSTMYNILRMAAA